MKVSNEIISGKLIMQIQIFIDNSRISSLEGRYGKVTMIPFTGHVKSEIFTGEIVPGGVDVQIENAQEIETCVQSTCFVAQIKKEKNALCLWKIMVSF